LNVQRSLLLVAALSSTSIVIAPSSALAGAVFYCSGGGCTGDGGNGDNGTNNGNNSSNNTINVNVAPNGAYARGAGAAASGSAAQNSVTVPTQLPSFSASGCGSRPTVYGGLTGTPGNGGAFGNSGSNIGFGVGLLTAIGKEPDSCKPPVVSYYVTTPPAQVAPPVAPPPVNRSSMGADVPSATFAAMPVSGACVPLDYDVAKFYAHDLRLAKHTDNTVRIDRDINALEKGCYHNLVINAISGH
jgi:hypothetical protein